MKTNFEGDNICRICMLTLSENKISIFEKNLGDEYNLAKKIMACASIQIIEGDGLPMYVCDACHCRINDAFLLKQLCHKSNETLLKMLCTSSAFSKEELFNFDSVKENAQSLDGVDFTSHNTITELETQVFLFKCSQCDQNFDTYRKLGTHIRIHRNRINRGKLKNNIRSKTCSPPKRKRPDPQRSFQCTICLEDPYKVFDQLVDHMKNKHDLDEVYNCNKCWKIFITQTDLHEHNCACKSVRAEQPIYTCEVCNKTYLKAKNLETHRRSHTGEMPITCSTCGKKFAQSRAYACHLRTHSNLKKIEPQTELDLNTALDEQTKADREGKVLPHTCTVCNKTYSNSGNLTNHMRLHTGEKPYSCNVCDRRFAQSNAHSYHMRTHTGERPFSCDICPKAFTTNGQLVNHKRLHTGEKPFQCTHCQRCFTQKTALTVHLMTHTGDKRHLCNVCGKKYSQNSQLVEHMRSHTGDTVQCDICGKNYSTSGNLAAHMKTHTGIKPHVCTVCDKAFYVAKRLVKHMRTHTGERPYQCTICAKRFANTDVLNVHMRRHTGIKPYECKLCGRGFVCNSQMTAHMKTHDVGAKGFVCRACSMAFTSYNALVVHLKICGGI